MPRFWTGMMEITRRRGGTQTQGESPGLFPNPPARESRVSVRKGKGAFQSEGHGKVKPVVFPRGLAEKKSGVVVIGVMGHVHQAVLEINPGHEVLGLPQGSGQVHKAQAGQKAHRPHDPTLEIGFGICWQTLFSLLKPLENLQEDEDGNQNQGGKFAADSRTGQCPGGQAFPRCGFFQLGLKGQYRREIEKSDRDIRQGQARIGEHGGFEGPKKHRCGQDDGGTFAGPPEQQEAYP